MHPGLLRITSSPLLRRGYTPAGADPVGKRADVSSLQRVTNAVKMGMFQALILSASAPHGNNTLWIAENVLMCIQVRPC